jgi:hypothetical protein
MATCRRDYSGLVVERSSFRSENVYGVEDGGLC